MTKYGYLGGSCRGTGIALQPPTRLPHHPGYTSSCYTELATLPTPYPWTNSAVGLRSVGQLSLEAHFSGFLGITEVYNLF